MTMGRFGICLYTCVVLLVTFTGSANVDSCNDRFHEDILKFVIDQWVSSNDTATLLRFYQTVSTMPLSTALHDVAEAVDKFTTLDVACQKSVLGYVTVLLGITSTTQGSTASTVRPADCHDVIQLKLLNFTISQWILQKKIPVVISFLQSATVAFHQTQTVQFPVIGRRNGQETEVDAALQTFKGLESPCQEQMLFYLNQRFGITVPASLVTTTPQTTKSSVTSTDTLSSSTTTTLTTLPTTSTTTKTQPPTAASSLSQSPTYTAATSATNIPVAGPTCNATKTANSLVNNVILTSKYAGNCNDGSQTRSEALVMYVCDSPHVDRWQAGPRVMDVCSQIPAYTPVAMFILNSFIQDGNSLSGIFFKCTNDGFKMVVQLCGHEPEIKSFSTTSSVEYANANNYYVVLYQ